MKSDIGVADGGLRLWRDEGMKRVFAMIHFRERVYYGG